MEYYKNVTGFPVWAAITTIGLVCAAYTTLGGMKAVIWADVFQTTVMIAGLLAAIIQGAIVVGGIEKVWAIASDGGRIEFFDFSPDPTIRHTFWTLVIGNFFVWLPPYTVDQQMMQRFSSTKSLRQAIIALLINIPSVFVMITLCSLFGIIIYSYYATCDQLTSGRVSDPNQLVPRFVMDIFYFAPGVPGLFTASLFSAALSSVSSMLNCLGAVTWEDFICFFLVSRNITVSDRMATTCNKILGLIFAGIGIGMGFLFSTVGGTVLQMSLAFNGASGAPMVGLFILGAFFPWSNWIGALVGGILGFAFPMWISIGFYVTKPPVMKEMENSVECCYVNSNDTSPPQYVTGDSWSTPATTTQQLQVTGITSLYTLSYLWYTTVGILTTVCVGLLVSFITGRTRMKDVDAQLLIPYVDKFWCCLPEPCKAKCRCGVGSEKATVTDSEIDDYEKAEKTTVLSELDIGAKTNGFAVDRQLPSVTVSSTDDQIVEFSVF